MSDELDTESLRIELTERQRQRLDRIKAECADESVPEPSDELMFDSLMDTWDAVGDGHYSDPGPLDRLRAFISRRIRNV